MPRTCELPGSPALASSAVSLRVRLGAMCDLCEESPHLFASPLGPYYFGGRIVRHPAALRLFRTARFLTTPGASPFWPASIAGTCRPSYAPPHLDQKNSLAEVESGHGLNLSFFPIVRFRRAVPGIPRSLPSGTLLLASGSAPENRGCCSEARCPRPQLSWLHSNRDRAAGRGNRLPAYAQGRRRSDLTRSRPDHERGHRSHPGSIRGDRGIGVRTADAER